MSAIKSHLHALIAENKAKEIEKLVKKDKKTLTELNEDGQPPLVAAVEQGRCSLAELLARLGADVNGTDTRGWNALHIACLNADLTSAALLLSMGANPNAATRDSFTTPLHYIVRHPYTKELENVMEMMFERKANPELRNGHGETPLHYAVMRCNEQVTRILLRHSADVNAANGVGETPLHKAARLGGPAYAICKLLLAAGANPSLQSRHGTPHQLVDAQYPDLKALLNFDTSPNSHAPSSSSSPASSAPPPIPPFPAVLALASITRYYDPPSICLISARPGPDGQPITLAASAAANMPTPSPQPLPSVRSPAEMMLAEALEEIPAVTEEGVATLISQSIGFRVESGKHNALINVELNLYDYTDHYKTIFAGKKQLHFVGYLTADDTDPTVISVLAQPETGKYPEPVHRGIVRTKSSGQDLFFIPASDVAAIRTSARSKNEKDKEEMFARQLQTHLQDTFFMGCRLWQVHGTKDKKEKDCDAAIEHSLVEFEHTDPERSNCFAFGVVYAKDGQSSCKEYWDNEHGSPGFDRFLSLLGQKITLKGWTKFRGGMDVASDSKGKESIYTHFEDKFEVMFHVSTLLPFHPADPLKIQNDVVVLIYQEGNTTYNPETMPTNVAHVFAIVRSFADPITGETKYRLGVVSKKNVNSFRPDLPFPPVFSHDSRFRHFLLTKLINGQIAARKSGLQMMFTRPRAAMLEEIVKEYRPPESMKPLKAGSFFGRSKEKSEP